MLAIFAPVISWIFRTVVIKFLILTAVFAVLAVVVPMSIDMLAPRLGTGGLTGAFSGLSSGLWFFLDYCALDIGLPMVISAYVTRFLIRRLPFIG